MNPGVFTVCIWKVYGFQRTWVTSIIVLNDHMQSSDNKTCPWLKVVQGLGVWIFFSYHQVINVSFSKHFKFFHALFKGFVHGYIHDSDARCSEFNSIQLWLTLIPYFARHDIYDKSHILLKVTWSCVTDSFTLHGVITVMWPRRHHQKRTIISPIITVHDRLMLLDICLSQCR